MIDFLVNEISGVTIVHDEKSLDACKSLKIDSSCGAVSLLMHEGPERQLFPLKGTIMEFIHGCSRETMTSAHVVRMSSMKIAKAHMISLELV